MVLKMKFLHFLHLHRLHFFLQCQQQYQTVRLEVLNGIYNVDPKIRSLPDDKLSHLLL